MKLYIKLLLAFCFGFLAFGASNVSAGELNMHAIYIGRGDAILLESQGHYMLVDSGTSEFAETLVNYLDKLNIPDNHLDYIVSTHPDGDHCGGFSTVFEKYTVGKLIYSPCPKAFDVYDEFIASVKEHKISFRTAVEEETWTLGDATIKVLYDGSQGSTYNECSIVMRATCDNKSILLTGDLPSITEKNLMKQGYNFKADILKLGHHGAASSSCADFLDNVKPTYAVASNLASAGFPKPNTLKRLARRFIKTYRTSDGDVLFTIKDGVISTNNKENNGYQSIKNGNIVVATPEMYATGKALKPKVSLYVDGALVPSNGYTVKYSSNKNTGIGKITLTGTEVKYLSTIKTTFNILPKTEVLHGQTGAKNSSIDLSWDKQSAANGYTIIYSTDKSFKTDLHYKTINNPKIVSATFKKLDFSTKYYFKIRAFKTGIGYGMWSEKLKVKTGKPPVPPKVTVTKIDLRLRDMSLKLVWKPISEKKVAGFIFQISRDRKFKDKTTVDIDIPNPKATSKRVKGLKKKIYFARVRSYNQYKMKSKWCDLFFGNLKV